MRAFVVSFILFAGTLTDLKHPVPSSTYNVKYTVDFDWMLSAGTDLGAPGAKTLKLLSCPNGVNAAEPEYWVRISGTGTPEVVRVTGGTCSGDGEGSLQFTTQHAHPPGYMIGSASNGLQEATIAAKAQVTNPAGVPQNGKVVVPPGTELKIYAPVSIRSSNQTVDFTGSIFECYVADSCIIVGDRDAASTSFLGITLVNPRGRPMEPLGVHPMIEVNAQKTRISNVMSRTSKVGSFGYFVQVDDDEAFLLDGVDPSVGGGLRCDEEFCGSVVYAPGPFGGHQPRAAVGYLKHMNLTMNGKGNCVDWQSGNTLRIADSVCQGFSQFGVRGGIRRGGYGGIELDNVYMEEFQGNKANPLGNIGQAGIIMQGGRLTLHSDRLPQGSQGKPFQDIGSTYYQYWIVASHATLGDSVPLPLGWARTNQSTPVEVTFPKIDGITGTGRYKVLRLRWDGKSRSEVPSGTGDWLVGTVHPATCRAICTMTDSHSAPTSFTTVNPLGGPVYYPLLTLWPGNIILGAGTDTSTVGTAATMVTDMMPGGIVSVARFVDGPVVFAARIGGLGMRGPQALPNYASLDPGYAGSPSYPLKNALILQSKASNNDGGQFTNYKGRINFLLLGTTPSPLVTWEDSDPIKTVADFSRRPPADPNDSDTGMYARGILYSRAKGEIRSYIGTLPDSTNWKERLTSSQKAFAVPVVINEGSTLTLGGGSPLSEVRVYNINDVSANRVPAQSCIDVIGKVSGVTQSDHITSVTPPGKLGNLSINAYASAANTIMLHFCNPSSSIESTPSGTYSFLAVH